MPKGIFPRNKREPIERFMDYVTQTDGCWLWGGRRDKDGYGDFTLDGRTVQAHRFMYQYRYGTLLPGVHVCHRCDNPSCVRPSHLFAGTDYDNHYDRGLKGRTAIGERNGRSKLTEADVAEIRRLLKETNLTQTEIAERYKVSRRLIFKIRAGELWGHIA